MVPRSLFAGKYVALAAVDSWLAGQPQRSRWRAVTKPGLMPLLHLATAGAPTRASTRRGLAAAHAASWGGDVALMAHGERAFLAGVGSFFAAHVAYVGTLASHRSREGWRWNAPTKVAVALWAGTTPVMALAARRQDPVLAVPVAVYGTALAGLLGAAGQLDGDRNPGAAREVLAGAVLFLASDTLLGTREFLLDGDRPVLESAVMATYTAAQALLAHGITRL
jgi:uncharacterized membrane protein YhhN